MKTLPVVILTAVVTVAATWFALRHDPRAPAAAAAPQAQHHQCSMHPWIRSDHPGRCTICGMELTPAAAGHPDHEGADGKVVELTQNQVQVLHVQTAEAKTRPLVRTLRVAGAIAENTHRHRVLAAYVDGRIDKLHVNYLGAEAAEGEPLAEFYSPTLLQAEREYHQLSGELRKNTALRLRQLGLTAAQIEALDQKSPDSLTSQILSPISGTVVSQEVYEGQYVVTGQRLFELADFSTMWFVFRAYEQDMPWIHNGQSVNISTPALPDRSFSGNITFIDPHFDEATRSTSVRVELPNPLVNGKRELLHRLYAEGWVTLDAPAVLTVPRTAVLATGPESVVYIERGGDAYERAVLKTGRRGDALVEVLAGLNEGERVVTNGNLLIDGQAELNRAFSTPDAGAPAPPDAHAMTIHTPSPPARLNDAQKESIAQFIQVADAMATALAADDLPAFTAASAPAMENTATLLDQLRPILPDGRTLDALDGARHFHGSKDLPAARAAFHAFSVAATAALEPLRKAGLTPEFQVYECGMVNQAIPGVPKAARWIQTGGRALGNPFFGKAMPDCGEEIKR
jgi:Cu(I)/Ag(I) efflux system membrane fusion protein